MFESNSRYASCATKSLDTDGRKIQYISRRFLPLTNKVAQYQQIMVVVNDRLDLIASRALGDAEQYWRICDINDTLHPLDLTSKVGKVLNIPIVRASF